MKTSSLAVVLCTAGVLCSCNPFKQRVDTAWLSESLSAPQDDAVVVENGQGLAQGAAPATTATPKRSWFSQRQSAPTVQGTQPTASTGGSWWSRRQQQVAPTPAVTTPAVPDATAPAVDAATTAVARTYTVQRGDTLSSIAAKYGVNTSTLIALNGLSANPNALQVGQVLNLPSMGSTATAAVAPAATAAATRAVASGTRTYTVVAGDTLSRIAARQGTTVAKIIAVNGFTTQQAHNLKIGQTIKLPKK